MNNKLKKANAFVYAIILVNLALIIAYVVYNNSIVIKNDIYSSEISELFRDTLISKANLSLEAVKKYNSNGGGFKDIISCPSDLIVRELNSTGGIIVENSLVSSLTNDLGEIYCEFLYNSGSGKLVFDDVIFTDIYFGEEKRNLVHSGGILANELPFSLDNTVFSFSDNYGGDMIDDNMNSDDYRSGSKDIPYPNGFFDDDILPRLIIYNNIEKNSGYYNVFWNTIKTSQVIDNNIFNNDNQSEILKISDISYINLFFDFLGDNLNYNIKLVIFDKDLFETIGLLNPIRIYNGTGIKNNNGFLAIDQEDNLYLSKNRIENLFEFDFININYGIFIENLGDSNIFLQIKGEERTPPNRSIYISSIDDSKNNFIEVLSNHIIIDGKNYIGEQKIIRGNK